MATRSIIQVQDSTITLYKHHDGYPDATLPWLEYFNKYFTEKRGNDAIYKIAQLVRSSIKDANTFDLDSSDLTGWGLLDNPDNWDNIEYSYFLKDDGTVEVFEGYKNFYKKSNKVVKLKTKKEKQSNDIA